MKSRPVRALVVCAAVLPLIVAVFAISAVLGAIGVTTTTASTQNFDGMGIPASATTPSTLPADFKVDAPSAVRTVGSFAAALSATARAGGAGLSTSAANGIYSFGAGTAALGSADRAVGFLSSGTATSSGNLYVQLTNTSGAGLSGLQISYNVEKYRNGSNPNGFRIQLFYSADGTTWTSAGTDFRTFFAADANNNGMTPVPGAAVAVNKPLNVAIPSGASFFLAWNYSVDATSTTTNAQALAIDDISITGLNSSSPTGTMTASPSSLAAGDSTLLTVTVTPGDNPVSTGLGVRADLSPIGGSATQVFAPAGGNQFTFNATIPGGVSGGLKTLTATITDAEGRTGTAQTSVTILTPTPPTGTGGATPATVAPGGTTTLTVNVTPGANPASTGITVTGNLSAIGIAGPQPFAPAGGNAFSYVATVAPDTAEGSKTLQIAVADAEGRGTTFNIALNVATPFVAPSVKISQVYGGGGNSGATYTNDFIELFNAGTTPVDLAAWSVQVTSSGGTTWNVTPLCLSPPCVIQPSHYFLVQEAIGATVPVQVGLPPADAIGTIAMSGTSAKVALVGELTPLSGGCPAGGKIVDFVGYGAATCFETAAAAGLGNPTADVRKGNGCTDTDNNSLDFVEITPIPRNGASPAHVCGDASQLTALGLATPAGPERGGLTTLTVHVTPASSGPSTGFSVVADLSSIEGSASQTFFDDASHGDSTAGDNTFSFEIRLPFTTAKGAHSVTAVVSDGVGTTLAEPITFTAALPTCGTERWSVKVGDDPHASDVDLFSPQLTTIGALRGFIAPATPPDNARVGPAETTSWVVNAMMTLFKKEADVDYHIVLSDTSGTVISEIPEPDCASDASPFRSGIAAARATFDSRLTATEFFQTVSLPVQVRGVGFFDFIHGQTGVAPNGIELHPVIDIVFQSVTTTAVTSSANPSKYLDDVAFTATVSSPGPVPTGQVTFFDGGSALATAGLDAQGHATFHLASLAVGDHSITASYSGDTQSASSRSAVLTQKVDPADQTITFDPIADKTFGDSDFAVSASSSSGLGVALAVVSGPATLSGTTVHITGAGGVTIRATQTGDGNFNAAGAVDRSFTVAKASQSITFAGPVPAPRYGALPFEVTAAGGASGNPVTFGGNGTCTVQGQNGIATVTIVSAGACHVVAAQAGNHNYLPAPETTETITIGRATAEVKVKPVTFVYDGQPHRLTGKATGVNGEDLGSLFDLGATFTNVPGGTATWAFAGDLNYLPANGQETVTITQAAPSFSSLSALVVEAGTPSAALGGVLSLGALVPTGNVVITLNGVSQTAAIGPGGSFAASLPTASLAPSSALYPVGYAYAGDNNFTSAGGTGSVQVVDTTGPSITGASATPAVLAPPSHKMIDITIGYQAADVTGAPVCALSIASNEPINGNGDGNTSVDWQVLDAHHVQLRSERAGVGSGRVYTITIRCTDSFGNTRSATTTVGVPK